MSVLPWTTTAPVGLERAQPVDDLGRARAVEDEVAGHQDAVRLVLLDVRQRGLERGDVAVDVAQDAAESRSAISPAPLRCGMMNEMRCLAADLAVDAGDRLAAAEAPAELLHRDLEGQPVTGLDDALEAALLDAGEEADAVAEALLLRDVDGHRLGQRLDLEHAGHDRQPGKWPWKNHSVAVTAFSPRM